MGEPAQRLVLVPGSLCNERIWDKQVAALGALAEIAVPSLHGHESLGVMAEAILSEVSGEFALCGFSMGGRVALEVFRRAPERVTRIALIDSSVHPVAPGEAERRRPQLDMAHTEGMAAFARWWYPQIAGPALLADGEAVALLEAMACTFLPNAYEAEVQALLTRPDPRDLLPHIAVPALVLAGVNDPLSTPERNRAIAAAIPGARLVLLEDCWHFPMLDRPDTVNAALAEWLTE